MDNLPDIVALVFEFIRPNLDSSRTKAKNGKKGGGASKTEAKEEKSPTLVPTYLLPTIAHIVSPPYNPPKK